MYRSISLPLIKYWGSVYYSNDGGKFYALSVLYLAPKENFVCPVFKFVVPWRSRKVLDSTSTSTPAPNNANTDDENEDDEGEEKVGSKILGKM
ncbi:hypothetical protein AMTRI_Chr03g144060 [Amborella trichopoda]